MPGKRVTSMSEVRKPLMPAQPSKLRIGLVGPLPPPSGGMANQTKQLIGLLQQQGCAVELVQVNAPYRPQWIEKVQGLRALFRLVPHLLRLWKMAGRVQVIHIMANSGWAWHLFAAPAIWIGYAHRTPVVVNYRGGEAGTFLAEQAGIIRWSIKRAALVVVPSGFLERVFAEHGIATTIVQNIINLERFQPVERAASEPHLIVTRNLEEIYDIATALRAFAQVRKKHQRARLTVAGSGPLHASLQALAAELGVAEVVTFTGRLDNERIASLYQSADLLLNSSLVDNMPISLLEAMASGVPIVSTNVGGIPHLVTDGQTALLVPPADPNAMARAALQVLGEPELAGRMRAAGLRAAQNYTWERVRPLLFAAYESAIGRSGAIGANANRQSG